MWCGTRPRRSKTLIVMLGCMAAVRVPDLAQAQPRSDGQQDQTPSPVKKELTADEVREAFERAMRDLETEKTQTNQAASSTISAKLQAAVGEWLAAAKEKKAAERHQVIEQHWEQLPESFGSPVHYEYYLRDVAYSATNQDALMTASWLAPYKATVRFLETLSVTRYYPPNTSYPERFRYTVTTPINVDFEYHGERFVVTRTERGQTKLDKGWR